MAYPVAVPDSIRVVSMLPLVEWPAAVQPVSEAQDTPRKMLKPVPGLGLGTTDQLVPSQDSIKVLELLMPAAVHAVAEAQDTA